MHGLICDEHIAALVENEHRLFHEANERLKNSAVDSFAHMPRPARKSSLAKSTAVAHISRAHSRKHAERVIEGSWPQNTPRGYRGRGAHARIGLGDSPILLETIGAHGLLLIRER